MPVLTHRFCGRGFFLNHPTNFPLYEGAMIWQFDHRYAKPRYWVKEADLRDVFHGKRIKRIDDLKKCPADLRNDYEVPRLAIRKIASNTNERTLGHFQKLGFLVSVSMEGRFLKCFRVLQTFRRADFRDKQRFQATTNGMSRDYSTTYPICGVLRPNALSLTICSHLAML